VVVLSLCDLAAAARGGGVKVWDERETGRADFRKPKRTPEKDVQRAVVQLLRLRHIRFFDTSQPRAAMVTAGLPDLIVCPPGRLLFVEVKAPGGTLSRPQRAFWTLCRAAGVPYHVVHSAAEMEQLL
jgi:VRR-NUC domain